MFLAKDWFQTERVWNRHRLWFVCRSQGSLSFCKESLLALTNCCVLLFQATIDCWIKVSSTIESSPPASPMDSAKTHCYVMKFPRFRVTLTAQVPLCIAECILVLQGWATTLPNWMSSDVSETKGTCTSAPTSSTASSAAPPTVIYIGKSPTHRELRILLA